MRALRPRAWTYDIWSVGVTWLELVLATPQVRVWKCVGGGVGVEERSVRV